MTASIAQFSQEAASNAVNGIANAIASVERGIRDASFPTKDSKLEDAAKEYFARSVREGIEAVHQLKQLKAVIHRRAFDALDEQ